MVDADAEVRSISGSFNKIHVEGGIDLFLSQSDIEAMAISTPDHNSNGRVKTIVEDSVLIISMEGGHGWNQNRRNKTIKAYVSFRELNKVEASGASDIRLAGSLKSRSLILNLSQASDFKGSVTVDTLTLNLSGASDVDIKGTASMIRIESSGASDVSGFDLTGNVCTIHASGASDISITVLKELNVHASGASNISYHGEGKLIDVQASGNSMVTRKDQ